MKGTMSISSYVLNNTYLNEVGDPIKIWVCVFHSEEYVASWDDFALRDSFDPDRKTAIMCLTQ